MLYLWFAFWGGLWLGLAKCYMFLSFLYLYVYFEGRTKWRIDYNKAGEIATFAIAQSSPFYSIIYFECLQEQVPDKMAEQVNRID